MGMEDVTQADPADLREFMKLLIRDVHALEKMLNDGMIEKGVRRIGAEQELFLVDEAYQAAARSLDVLEVLDDPHYTTELGLFNIEFNCDPLTFKNDCLRQLEGQVNHYLDKSRKACQELGLDVVMAGILPTLKHSDLSLDKMTPNPRYYALNDALCRQRGGLYNFHIKGTDEFRVEHDNVMLESANTSFQVHFQCGPDEFARLYNVAQAVTAPLLAVAVNSPLLFGKRLWRETRIALFQQSVDTRGIGERDKHARVSFGHRWLDDSALEVFREDVARFRVLVNTEIDEDPFQAIADGRAPSLKALRLHNGTIYRWNRACYGISEGKPHLRIEARALPAGPSVLDEMANAAFWFGMMISLEKEHHDIREVMEFDDANTNFLAAAQQGLNAPITWTDGKTSTASELILGRLLPMAREGLADRGIPSDDISRYLDVIQDRVEAQQTGSQWALTSFNQMKASHRSIPERLTSLVAATISRQMTGEPVHKWPLVNLSEGATWKDNFYTVEQFMTTDLYTVNEDELVELVVSVMDWQKVRHVPVEDENDRLVGLVTYLTLLRYLNREDSPRDSTSTVPVSAIMEREVIFVTPDTLTIDAIRLMREKKISCLPVVKEGKLVGMITETDFVMISAELMEERLS